MCQADSRGEPVAATADSRNAQEERGEPCPRELVMPGTRGHGCPRSNLESTPPFPLEGVFKNGSRRRKEANFGAKNTSASLPDTVLATMLGLTLPCPQVRIMKGARTNVSLNVCSGVRPSSAAATSARSSGSVCQNAAGSPCVSVPEDRRAPLNTYMCPCRDSRFGAHVPFPPVREIFNEKKPGPPVRG